jgi:cytochrome b6-f complex iron-sulfur subunit
MERRKFFLLLGAGALTLAIGSNLASCSKNNAVPDPPSNVDFTLDLSLAEYSGLLATNSSVYQNGLIIAHVSTGEYIALSQVCTHAGCTVEFNGFSSFNCPCHGSSFTKTGAVTGGPASSPLKSYNTALNGKKLRIYS